MGVKTGRAAKIFGGITTSHNKGKGTGEGIENVNSKFEVGGTHRSEAGETGFLQLIIWQIAV